jgi:hypothetical protein
MKTQFSDKGSFQHYFLFYLFIYWWYWGLKLGLHVGRKAFYLLSHSASPDLYFLKKKAGKIF